MTLAEAISEVSALRNRCPRMPGSVPLSLNQRHREALTLVLAAAGVENTEPKHLPRAGGAP